MVQSTVASQLKPPGAWAQPSGGFLDVLRSPWHRLTTDLQDAFTRTTAAYAHEQGARAVHLPITGRTVTCPSGLGSDSQPVPVTVGGVDTYLADSMQFLLEYACRLTARGCWCILPSFRLDEPDRTHLAQFTHSEAELVGDLDTMMGYVERYVRRLAADMLAEYGAGLRDAVGTVRHLERMVAAPEFPRLTFAEAAALLGDDPDLIADDGNGRTFTRRGERRLMELAGEFVWVTHFDHLSVPFYQAFGDDNCRTARNADLFFGIGEVVGSGERHATGDQARAALAHHRVSERDYAWYVRMKDELPLRTAGFGLGVERFLLWVLRHDDIRDIPSVSRIGEPARWPASVDRP
jgi:asparaginyl-tRNA synthetase